MVSFHIFICKIISKVFSNFLELSNLSRPCRRHYSECSIYKFFFKGAGKKLKHFFFTSITKSVLPFYGVFRTGKSFTAFRDFDVFSVKCPSRVRNV